MKLTIITAVHGRHRIFRRMLLHHQAIALSLGDRHEISIVAVCSPEDYRHLQPIFSTEVKIPCVLSASTNRPLSRKWQLALELARLTFRPDAVMILGSDDFATEAYFRHTLGWLESGILGLGPDSLWFLDQSTGVLGHWRGPMRLEGKELPARAGGIFGRGILDACGWLLFDFDADRRIDTLSARLLDEKTGYRPHVVRMASVPGAAVLDVKNGANLHGWGEIPYAHVLEPGSASKLLKRFRLAEALLS